MFVVSKNCYRPFLAVVLTALIATFALPTLARDASAAQTENENSLDNVLLALSALSGEQISLSGNIDPNASFTLPAFDGDMRTTLDEILHNYSYYLEHNNNEYLVHIIGPAEQAGGAYEAIDASAYALDDPTQVATFTGPDGELEILPAEPLDQSDYQYETLSGPDGELEVFLTD